MNLPPAVVDLRFSRPDGGHRRLWLPVAVLWPFLVPIALVALLVAILVDAVLYAVDRRSVGWTRVVVGIVRALPEAKGLHVTLSGPKTNLRILVK